MNCDILIEGNRATVSGDFSVPFVRQLTSYPVQGAQFSDAYKKGRWDGRKHLFNLRTSKMPSGLVTYVVRSLKKKFPEIKIAVTDNREDSVPAIAARGLDVEGKLKGLFGTGKYDFQMEAAEMCLGCRRGILKIATNGGKCLGLGTLVLKYDGSRVPVEEIQAGDLLMGPDSGPRRVLSTTKGLGPLYKVIPNKGDPWICNDVHVLTLVNSSSSKIVDIPLNEYFDSSNNFKHLHKQFMVGVEFSPHGGVAENLPLHPYFVGLWLGDGTKGVNDKGVFSTVKITSEDGEVLVPFLKILLKQYSVKVFEREEKDRCNSIIVTKKSGVNNEVLDLLRIVLSNKFRIPHKYLTSSRIDRLSLLAGLIDSDGYHHNGSYTITQKRKLLAEDIWFLARSLGYRSLLSKKVVKGQVYWRVSIVGDCSEVPVQLERKRAYKRKHFWNHTRTGFTVEPLGIGEYAGFELDGDGRFLLGDFTVTHNTAIAGAVTRHLSIPTLFVVPGVDLLHQTSEEMAEYLGISMDDVGLIGDQEFSVGDFLTVATADSLALRLEDGSLDVYKDKWQLLWADECHTAGSDTLYTALDAIPAYYRFGLSGTPLDRSDGATLRLIAQTGEVIYEVKNSLLVERGISVQPLVKFIRVDQPKIPKTRNGKKLTYGEVTAEAILENPFLNDQVIKYCLNYMDQGKQCIIMVDKMVQLEIINEGLSDYYCGSEVHGKIKGEARKEIYDKFMAGEFRYLIGTSVLNQGLNMDCIDVLVFAGGGKAAIPTLQRSGRGLRAGNGRTELIIVDMINTCHKWMIEHTKERIETYKKEECFLMSMIDEDADFTE